MHRYIEKPTKLSDSTLLPKGAWVTVAATPAKDASVWSEPDTFDGLRFYNLRQQAGSESRYQLTTTSSEQIGFGVGRHACPGRFFASHELKILLAHLILKFDWKLSDGEQGRPKSLEIGTEMMPNRNVVLWRKSREV
jgi:cytochrome P450